MSKLEFKAQPEEATKFLRRAIDNLRRQESYESICHLVDPSIVLQAIGKIYPNLPDKDYKFPLEEPWEKQAAKLFIEAHKSAANQQMRIIASGNETSI